MRVSRIELLPYRVTPGRAAHNASSTWSSRSGLLLRLYDSEQRVGQGEAAPLPGYSPDDLPSAEAALRALVPSRFPELSPEQPLRALERVAQLLPPRVPSARAALEGAMLDLLAQAVKQPAWAVLRRALGRNDAPDAKPLAALMQPRSLDALCDEAEAAVARGIRTLKIKIGRPGAFARELAALERLRARLPDVALRLDANRAFAADDAPARLDALSSIVPEYVEEPTADWRALGASAVPLALDESLLDPELPAALAEARTRLKLCACVVKPSLLGGITPLIALAGTARALGLDLVFSHMFEGPAGFALAAALAFALGAPNRALGLDRHAVLECWPGYDTPRGATLAPSLEPGLGLPLLEAPS